MSPNDGWTAVDEAISRADRALLYDAQEALQCWSKLTFTDNLIMDGVSYASTIIL